MIKTTTEIQPLTRRLSGPWNYACIALVGLAIVFAGCATGNNPSGGPTDRSGGGSREQTEDANSSTIPSPNLKTLYAMARILNVQGKDAQSEAVLKRIIAQYPDFVPAYSDLAKLYMAIGQLEDAKQTLDTALELAPGDPVLLNNRGVCELFKEDYAAALAQFRRAAQSAPREDRYQGNIALALALQERYDEALDVYARIIPEDEAQENLDTIRAMRRQRGELREMLAPP
ncbi:MAG: tetratricopeptide repeat protein, partial [Candidatus Hydrogenedentota bacterium]